MEKLLRAWRALNPEQRIAFARTLGVDVVWDELITPIVSDERATSTN